MVALRNPVVDRAALVGVGASADDDGPGSAAYGPAGHVGDDIRERAAAVDLLEARSRALERMGRSGVQIVDALPGPGVEAVLRRYAEIKSRSLL